jgi:hypothetical protein
MKWIVKRFCPLRLSRSILQLIDEAIIPALLVFGAKLVGLVLANSYYGLSWDVAHSGNILPLLSYRSPEAFALANSFSNVLTYAVILIGFLWVLIRAHAFHASHISPKMSVSLVSMEMTGLVVNSWEIYHQAIVWLAYLWLALLLFSVQAMMGVSPWWLALGGGMVALLFSWLFIADVEREVELQGKAS